MCDAGTSRMAMSSCSLLPATLPNLPLCTREVSRSQQIASNIDCWRLVLPRKHPNLRYCSPDIVFFLIMPLGRSVLDRMEWPEAQLRESGVGRRAYPGGTPRPRPPWAICSVATRDNHDKCSSLLLALSLLVSSGMPNRNLHQQARESDSCIVEIPNSAPPRAVGSMSCN
jgi:hypothetical protein